MSIITRMNTTSIITTEAKRHSAGERSSKVRLPKSGAGGPR